MDTQAFKYRSISVCLAVVDLCESNSFCIIVTMDVFRLSATIVFLCCGLGVVQLVASSKGCPGGNW